jgi:hypothetical protein
MKVTSAKAMGAISRYYLKGLEQPQNQRLSNIQHITTGSILIFII